MAKDLVVPRLGESIAEAVIARWLKNVGDAVVADEPVVELETDKVSVQLPAPMAGKVSERLFAEGATVRVGTVIGRIEKNGVAVTTVAPPLSPPTTPPEPTAAATERPLSPAKRRAQREKPETTVLTIAPPAEEMSTMPTMPVPPAPIPTPTVAEEIVPMSPFRRTIATRLLQAQQNAATLTTFNDVDMTAVMDLRARYQESFQAKHGIKLGFMSFFAKACVAALQDFPVLNAEIRGTDIVYKKYYNIGIAVGSGRGLVVPVVRNVDQLNFAEIEKIIADYADKAKNNKLSLDELTGGTFTITNGGIYGSLLSTPLLNYPQTGILGMHKIAKRPVAIDDHVAVRPMMYLALTYDHRLVDGREAVQFLLGIKNRVEQPERLMFAI